MKNKIITATSTGLTTHSYVVYNCEMPLTSTGEYDIAARPQVFYFKNTSNITVEFNFLTRQELKEFQTSQTNFAGVRILNNDYFIQEDILGKGVLDPSPSFVIIKGVSGTANNNLTIYCLNYI